jgi:hypothetical protein
LGVNPSSLCSCVVWTNDITNTFIANRIDFMSLSNSTRNEFSLSQSYQTTQTDQNKLTESMHQHQLDQCSHAVHFVQLFPTLFEYLKSWLYFLNTIFIHNEKWENHIIWKEKNNTHRITTHSHNWGNNVSKSHSLIIIIIMMKKRQRRTQTHYQQHQMSTHRTVYCICVVQSIQGPSNESVQHYCMSTKTTQIDTNTHIFTYSSNQNIHKLISNYVCSFNQLIDWIQFNSLIDHILCLLLFLQVSVTFQSPIPNLTFKFKEII